MFQFIGGFPKVDIHINKFKKKLDAQLKVETRNAAREWLRATYQRVPVLYGTARGTLLPLSKLLRVAVPISPVKFGKNRGPGVGATKSSFEFNFTTTTYSFTFDQQLFYYELNDQNIITRVPSSPWHSFDHGAEAFKNYMDNVTKTRLPQLSNYVVISEVRIG